MDGLNIAMVGYLNTLPFEYGLKKIAVANNIKLMLDVPAKCTEYFQKGEADLALVPVGSLQNLEDFEICLDYGIACDGPVRTVCVFSNTEIRNCTRIHLDKHSKTSRLLIQLLMRDYFQQDIHYKDSRVSQMEPLAENEAVLMIGDKVFEYEGKYKFAYDLGDIWKKHTGKPFVFAVWIKRKGLDLDEEVLNNALATGMQKIPELVKTYAAMTNLSQDDVDDYININLRHYLNKDFKSAMIDFLEAVKTL